MRLDDFCKVVKGHDIVIIYIYTNKIVMKIFKSIKNDLPSYSIQVSPWLVFLQVLAQVICSLLVAHLYRSFLSFITFITSITGVFLWRTRLICILYTVMFNWAPNFSFFDSARLHKKFRDKKSIVVVKLSKKKKDGGGLV